MTNEAYLFNSTNRERAVLRRSAAHRKNGSKSKSCKLEVDRMTQKEIAKKHGPVSSWKMSDFYTWDEFKKMPLDIQVEWLNHVLDKYNVSLSTISAEVFQLSTKALGTYLSRMKVSKQIHSRRGGRKVKKEDFDAFKMAILNYREGPRVQIDTEKVVDVLANTPEVYPIFPEEIKMAEKSESDADKATEAEPEPVYLSMGFATSYISKGIDLEMLPGIAAMFEGKMVRVTFEVSIL